MSAVITADASERRAYDQVLDQVSKPLMHAIRGQVEFANVQTAYPDGVVSNFNFTAQEVARPIWRYPDLGPHVVYLSSVIARTISEQMREESKYLRRHYRARQALKEIVEMPDHQADLQALLPALSNLYERVDYPRGLVLFHAAARLRASTFNYISLETSLSDAGVISQIPINWITLMSAGRSNNIGCGAWGSIEFVRTCISCAR